MWRRFWKGMCRWCGEKVELNGAGRCKVCDTHYKRNRARGGMLDMMG